jgi:large subunit ribosomal protein L10
MPTAEKEDKVGELTEKMESAKALFVADFTGIDVATVSELRDELRQAEVEYQVVKNRLAIRAAEAAGIEGLGEYFTGPTALAFVNDDPVAPAKILQKYVDDDGKISIKSGLVDGQLIKAEQFKQLASLPSRDELLAKVVGSIQAPLAGFHGVLSGLMRNLVGALGAIEKKRQEEGE